MSIYFKYFFTMIMIFFVFSCSKDNITDNNLVTNNKSENYSFYEDSLIKKIYPTTQNFITYRDKINDGFVFIQNYLYDISFDDNEINYYDYFYSVDTLNNILKYYSIKNNDTLYVTSQIFTDVDGFKIKGTSEIYFNSVKILYFEEKFTDTTLITDLNFLENGSYLSLNLSFNLNDSLANNRPFRYTISGKINSENINISNSMNDIYDYEKINEIKEYSADLFSEPLKNYTIGLIYLNNLWIGWDSSNNNLSKPCECVEPCYGDDDAWLSFAGSVITGLFNPIAGIVYGAIDTYIATQATD